MTSALLESAAVSIVTPPPAVQLRVIPAEKVVLSGPDVDKLLLVIDSSLKVRRRHHFFSWSQGPLQTLLPHDIIICALNDGRSRDLCVQNFSSVPISDKNGNLLFRDDGGLIKHLVRSWRKFECQPVAYERGGAGVHLDEQLAAHLARLPYANVIAHGLRGVNGEPSKFFAMFCMPGAIGARQIYLLDALVPYLHTTWLRVHIGCEPAAEIVEVPAPPRARVLTEREIEIMHWVREGKSNIEIGMILKISPLTVKNHVQKILRKLDVQNRTQAVAKSLFLNILQPPRRS